MRVLFISSYINPHSGAAALWSLKYGLEKRGCDCYVLSDNPYQHNEVRKSEISSSQKLAQLLYRNTINRIIPSVYKPFGNVLIKSVRNINPDIINIHWTHGAYPIPITVLKRLSESWPIVWTIHDMWPITGFCPFSFECDRYLKGCGHCPHQLAKSYISDLSSFSWKFRMWTYSNIQSLVSRFLWKFKRRNYSKIENVVMVAASKWLEKVLNDSPIHHFEVFHIPYAEDTEIFKPYDNNVLRNGLNIPQEAKVVFTLLGGNMRKGDDLIPDIFDKVSSEIANCYLLLGGDNQPIHRLLENIKNISYKYLGRIQDNQLLAHCYSVADVFITTTRADTLPLVILKSIACGTPVVASNVGGISDVVIPDKTGILVGKDDTNGFVFALKELLNDEHKLMTMSKYCVEYANKNFHIQVQADRYMNLFDKIISKE